MVAALSAFTIAPDRGSEPLAGWQWVRSIARVTGEQVCVVTRPTVEDRLTRDYGDELRKAGVRFHAIDLPWTLRRHVAKGRLRLLYYVLWQYHLAAQLRQTPVDWSSVHHLTFASSILPAGIVAAEAPAIVGPISAVDSPRTLIDRAPLREQTHDGVHWLLRRTAPHLVPLARRAFRSSTVVVTPGSHRGFAASAGRIIEAPPLVADAHAIRSTERTRSGGPTRIAVLGRMIYWKGHSLALRAAAAVSRRGVRARWTFIGDGGARAKLEREARELRLEDVVDFVGWLPRKDALATLARHDLLVHPAFREGWGSALLEAMALGLPVVCLDWGGPGAIGAFGGAIRVSVGNPELTAERIADAVEQLSDVRMRAELGKRARAVVEEHFSESALDRHVAEIYATNGRTR